MKWNLEVVFFIAFFILFKVQGLFFTRCFKYIDKSTVSRTSDWNPNLGWGRKIYWMNLLNNMWAFPKQQGTSVWCNELITWENEEHLVIKWERNAAQLLDSWMNYLIWPFYVPLNFVLIFFSSSLSLKHIT